MRRASEFFWVSVTRYYDPNTCKPYETGDPSQFSLYAMYASAVVLICIFFAVYRGVKSSSVLIWVTVPLPVLFIIVMLIYGLTLEGSSSGISDYWNGRDEVREDIVMGQMWADAVG